MKRRRFFPRTLAECIEPLAAPLLREQGVEAKLLRHWPAIMGAELAENCTPHRIVHKENGGILVIQTSGGFATEIQHMEPVILERMATFFGYRAAVRIKIEQVAAPAPKPPKKVLKPGAPVTLPVEVEDEEIRAALTRLGEALQRS